jgi:5-methyltetrahydrofolate--homocysteine methyltransferase
MDAVMGVKRGVPGAELPPLRGRRVTTATVRPDETPLDQLPARSDVATDNSVPTPPFWGPRAVKGVALADYVNFLDERATFLGQWGLKPGRGDNGVSYDDLVETEGRPRLRMWLDRVHTDGLLEAAVVYGYLVILHHEGDLVGQERARLTFPRQRRDRHLCLSDFFRSKESGETDVIAFHVVTMGSRVAEATGKLFAENSYRDYLELHGLSVQLTEALAEMWHARIRTELGFDSEDVSDMDTLIGKQGYRGSRYSFGYPACPDVEQQAVLVELLEPQRIGVELSEEFQLHPEQSTSALIVHHPEAKYFNAT